MSKPKGPRGRKEQSPNRRLVAPHTRERHGTVLRAARRRVAVLPCQVAARLARHGAWEGGGYPKSDPFRLCNMSDVHANTCLADKMLARPVSVSPKKVVHNVLEKKHQTLLTRVEHFACGTVGSRNVPCFTAEGVRGGVSVRRVGF